MGSVSSTVQPFINYFLPPDLFTNTDIVHKLERGLSPLKLVLGDG